jgi:DNA polymerase III subunit delta'
MNAGLPPLQGHEETRRMLGRAHFQGSLPQSILLHGPPGAGKERLALWLGQLLVCEGRDEAPCRQCTACRLAERLEHPDVHWFFPLPRPEGASSPEKLRERLEEQRADVLRQRREGPLRLLSYDRPPAHYLAAVRTMQQFASVRPAAGAWKVLVVGDAELMVPQESSPEAANAFLKLLEEPPPNTTLVLTSSHPGGLLPTIRSRVLSVRVQSLPPAAIARLLAEGGVCGEEEATTVAGRANGSLDRALRICARGDGGESLVDREWRAGRELLVASLSTGAVARLGAAHERRPAGARGELLGELDALATWLRDLLAVAAGAPERVSDPASLPILRRAAERRGVDPRGVMDAIERVAGAKELALGNVNPQLILADLLRRIQIDLRPPGAQTGRADR